MEGGTCWNVKLRGINVFQPWCQRCSELHFRINYPDSARGVARGRNEPHVLDLVILVGLFQPRIFCVFHVLSAGEQLGWFGTGSSGSGGVSGVSPSP